MSTQRQAMSVDKVNAYIQTHNTMSIECAAFLFSLQVGRPVGDIVSQVIFESVVKAETALKGMDLSHPYILGNPIWLAISVLVRWSTTNIVRYTSHFYQGNIVLIPANESLGISTHGQLNPLGIYDAYGRPPRFVTRAPNIEKYGAWDIGRYAGELWFGRMESRYQPGVFWPQGPFIWVEDHAHPHGGTWDDPYEHGGE